MADLEERRVVEENSLDVRVDQERLAKYAQLGAGRVRVARRMPGAASRGQAAIGSERGTASGRCGTGSTGEKRPIRMCDGAH